MSIPPENPYAPPEARVADMPGAIAYGSPAKAILFGLTIDIGGTLAAEFFIGVLYAIAMSAQGVPPEDLQAGMTNPAPFSALGMTTLLAGLGFSILGGYACSRVAKRREYRLGLMLAAIDTLTGLLFLAAGSGMTALAVVSLPLTFACVMGGAHLGAAKNRRLAVGPDHA